VLSFTQFQTLSGAVKSGLELEGYEVDISFSGKTAFRCNIRIPKLLFQHGILPLEHEKILIQLDTESQGFEFEPTVEFINKFDVFRPILVTPISILLSQKIVTAFSRRRPKGRDFYDILFLLGKTLPNYEFLAAKIGVTDSAGLMTYIRKGCAKIDFKELVDDLRPFVFNPSHADRILLFTAYVETHAGLLEN
ncbi:MAG: nucleotidyl transferase AbiEii/AbiGii toxin family protein, partial [Candidatus Margulisiibacteriota bacterium]